MTATPAADCGVSGGCGACPLGRAEVCGDPVPLEVGRGDNGQGPDLPPPRFAVDGEGIATDRLAPLGRPLRGVPMAEAIAALDRTLDELAKVWAAPSHVVVDPAPVCVQTPSGVVPCGSSRLCRSPEEVADEREARRTGGTFIGKYLDEPDVDPDEPKPAGAGCCGGACGG